MLSGDAYKKRDLEPVDDDSDDDEEEENKPDYDEAGHLLPSQNTHFYLGRYCAANAEMGHKLTHWQYHLNQNLLGYLEEQGAFSFNGAKYISVILITDFFYDAATSLF